MAFNPIENDVNEAMRFDAPISNAPAPRWQRKMQEVNTPRRAEATTPHKTPRSASARTPKGNRTPSGSDRFIPSRSSMNMTAAHFSVTKENSPKSNSQSNSPRQAPHSPSSAFFKQTLADNMLSEEPSAKILALKQKAPAAKEGHQNQLRVLYSAQKSGAKVKPTRNIPTVSERTLDAPGILDDYYLNLLDWNSNNQVAVALAEAVYVWDASTGQTVNLCQLDSSEDSYVTSVSWIKNGSFLAVGTSDAEVQLWDVERQRRVRTMTGHLDRVGALAWNQHILSSGSRTGHIHNHDVRVAAHVSDRLVAHSQEVCGLKWSEDGTMLASGGNDNLLNLWEQGRYESPKFTIDAHQAAIKALAWCPWQKNLLATGGGTADRHIRFWNTSTGACVNSIDTQSQVCSLMWSRDHRELVSGHGFTKNQLTVWKYPSLVKVAELLGHSQRVLHMAMSPDGSTVVSAAGDETLRFWRCFEADAAKKAKKAQGPSAHSSALARSTIR